MRRRARLSRGNSRAGVRNAVTCCRPPARLVARSGVTLPGAAPVVSMVLAHGSSTALSCTFTGERSEEHTSELQSRLHLVCRLLLEKKKKKKKIKHNSQQTPIEANETGRP